MMRFCIGELVTVNNRTCIIRKIPSFDVVQVQDSETHVFTTVARSDVHPLQDIVPSVSPKAHLTEQQKKVRDLRFAIIEPILGVVVSRKKMTACAEKAVKTGLLKKGDISTIYDWIRKYKKSNNKNSLAPPIKPSGGRGKVRLSDEVNDLLTAVIDGHYLTSQKKKPTAVFDEVWNAFRMVNKQRERAGQLPLKTPCKKTVLDRIKALDPKLAEEKRYGKKAAKENIGIMQGHLRCGKWPWELGQMDHKELRVRLIDEVTGDPLDGLPWITAIIDTNSRIVPGFVLSHQKPAAINIGLCLAMSMVQKDYWLKKWGLDADDFPVFGKWGTVQADNELKNEAAGIIAGCDKRDITLEFRPLKSAQSGGYIESFFRTLDLQLRNVEGYESKIKRNRDNYNSRKKSFFTLEKLAEYIAVFIIKKYSLRKHSGLGRDPLNAYKHNLMESEIGIPELLVGDEIKYLILDFMPYEMRTIQEYGVQIFSMQYRSQDLEYYRKQGKRVR